MSSTQIFWVGAESRDASALPCTGIRGTFDVADMPGLPANALVGVWVAIELANSNWSQIGYFIADGIPEGFYQLWDLPTNSILGAGNWNVPLGTHQFTIVYSGADNVWDFYMDDTLEGSYDMGSPVSAGPTASQPAECLVEQQQPPFAVPTVTIPIAMQVQQNGVWHDVVTATAYATTSTYGVQGNLQNSSLADNSIVVGAAIPATSAGTTLWTESTTLIPVTIEATVEQV